MYNLAFSENNKINQLFDTGILIQEHICQCYNMYRIYNPVNTYTIASTFFLKMDFQYFLSSEVTLFSPELSRGCGILILFQPSQTTLNSNVPILEIDEIPLVSHARFKVYDDVHDCEDDDGHACEDDYEDDDGHDYEDDDGHDCEDDDGHDCEYDDGHDCEDDDGHDCDHDDAYDDTQNDGVLLTLTVVVRFVTVCLWICWIEHKLRLYINPNLRQSYHILVLQ